MKISKAGFKTVSWIITLAIVFSLISFAIPQVSMANTTGTTYYVDSVSGDDTKDGTTQVTAWRTLEKVNSAAFQPGDKILFKAGGVWNGQLFLEDSGAEGNPIVVDMYGSGNKPVINGNGTTYPKRLSGAVMLYNADYVEINNLEVTNTFTGDTATDSALGRMGILAMVSRDRQNMKHVYIKNCYVHDVHNDPAKFKPAGGIIFVHSTLDKDGTDMKYFSNFEDILVEGCTIKNVSMTGIRNCGDSLSTSGTYPSDLNGKNIVYRNNYLEDIGGDGIVIQRCPEGGVVESNVANRHCNRDVGNKNYAGIWASSCANTIFQFNEAYNGIYGWNDGEAYDVDLNCQNVIYQYNYSHNNRGGFCLFMGNSTGSIFRYNVSVNDGNNAEIFHYLPTSDTYAPLIYNNTIYIGSNISTRIFHQDTAASIYAKLYNNIIQADGQVFDFSSKTLYGDFKNNCFYPATIDDVRGPSAHPGLVTQNPQLAWPGKEETGLGNVAYYKLNSTSPCIDAGIEIANNGGRDYFGNSLYNGAPDIGAHEFTNDPGPQGPSSPTGIYIDKTRVFMRQGEKIQLTATLKPDDFMNRFICWNSSDTSIVTVSTKGELQAIAKGEAVITATSGADPSFSVQCKVTVGDSGVTTATYNAVADSYINGGIYAGTNFGTKDYFYVKKSADSNLRYTYKPYIMFDFSSYNYESINRAVIRLYARSIAANSQRTIGLYATGEDWTETGITWNNAPAKVASDPVSTQIIYNKTGGTDKTGYWYEFDVTDYVRSNISDKKISVLVDTVGPANDSDAVEFSSKEDINGRTPQLVISCLPITPDSVEVTTTVGVAPTLPATVNATIDNGTIVNVNVEWEVIEPAWFLTQGSFAVKGTIIDAVYGAYNVPVIASVTVEGRKDEVTLSAPASTGAGEQFMVNLGLTGVTESVYSKVYAEDITINFDTNLFNFVSAQGASTKTVVAGVYDGIPGSVRILVANDGGISGDIQLLNLIFKAKNLQTTASGNIAVVKAELGTEPDGSLINAKLAQASIIVAAMDKSTLASVVISAQAIYDAAVEGTNPGQYTKKSKAALKSAIGAAQAVLSSETVSQKDVNEAIIALNAAVDTFKASVIVAKPGDVNKDGSVDVTDLALAASYYLTEAGEPGWDNTKGVDMNNNGRIDISDLQFVAKQIFNW